MRSPGDAPAIRAGSNPILNHLKTLGIPLSLREYLELLVTPDPLDPLDGLPAELAGRVPGELLAAANGDLDKVIDIL